MVQGQSTLLQEAHSRSSNLFFQEIQFKIMAQHFEEFYSDTFACLMKQVSLPKARRLFNEGHTIYLHPSKMRFDNVWQSPIPISKKDWDNNIADAAIDPFDNVCNHFRVYNCNSDSGKTIHYFIQVQV